MRLFLIVLLSLLVSLPASAEEWNVHSTRNAWEKQGINPETGLTYDVPAEPQIPQVKFLQVDPPGSLQEKIERLRQGIKTYISPEYDQYGYELRRYMTHVGNVEIYSDPEKLSRELGNVRKAKIIFSYWAKDLDKEMDEIEAEIAKGNTTSTIRSSYTYNKGAVAAFLTECQSWLNNNEALLEFLTAIQGLYTYKDPDFTFSNAADKSHFIALYNAREESRKHINEYQPFSLMIY